MAHIRPYQSFSWLPFAAATITSWLRTNTPHVRPLLMTKLGLLHG